VISCCVCEKGEYKGKMRMGLWGVGLSLEGLGFKLGLVYMVKCKKEFIEGALSELSRYDLVNMMNLILKVLLKLIFKVVISISLLKYVPNLSYIWYYKHNIGSKNQQAIK